MIDARSRNRHNQQRLEENDSIETEYSNEDFIPSYNPHNKKQKTEFWLAHFKQKTAPILTALQKLMNDRRYVQEPLAAYIVPSRDAHNSQYLADIDKRREAVSGFTGSAGTGIVTQSQVRG